MKQLSIEEKAKRYDEALDNAKVVYKTIRKDLKPVIEQIFPELAESEDERIRKQIISFLKEFEGDHYRSLDFSSWIAWLEKQRDKPLYTFDDILALQCCMETVKKVQEDKELYEQLQSLHDRLHDAYWLEKQGGQIDITNKEYWRGYREGKQEILDKYAELEQQGKYISNILWHDVSEEPDEHCEIFCEWNAHDDVCQGAVLHDVVFYHADTKTFVDGEQQIDNIVKWAYIDEILLII